jgi:hypothetical protein
MVDKAGDHMKTIVPFHEIKGGRAKVSGKTFRLTETKNRTGEFEWQIKSKKLSRISVP